MFGVISYVALFIIVFIFCSGSKMHYIPVYLLISLILFVNVRVQFLHYLIMLLNNVL